MAYLNAQSLQLTSFDSYALINMSRRFRQTVTNEVLVDILDQYLANGSVVVRGNRVSNTRELLNAIRHNLTNYDTCHRSVAHTDRDHDIFRASVNSAVVNVMFNLYDSQLRTIQSRITDLQDQVTRVQNNNTRLENRAIAAENQVETLSSALEELLTDPRFEGLTPEELERFTALLG